MQYWWGVLSWGIGLLRKLSRDLAKDTSLSGSEDSAEGLRRRIQVSLCTHVECSTHGCVQVA